METLDQTLKKYWTSRHLKGVNHRSDEILASLAKQVLANVYLTERQANLAVKIFRENSDNFNISENLLKTPLWEKSFRIIDRYKYIHLVKNSSSDHFSLEIGFNHSTFLSKKLDDLRKSKLKGSLTKIKNNVWQIPYTETDLFHLVEFVKNQNFEISSEITDAYEKISGFFSAPDDYKIFIDRNAPEHLKNLVTAEVGEITNSNILLEDRKIAYQYEIFDSFFEKKLEKLLSEKISLRHNPTIYVSPAKHGLEEIFNSLKELQRLPALVIFDNSPEKSMKNLEILEKSLSLSNLDSNVGIYFRQDSTPTGKPFNEKIAQLGYNKPLNNYTEVVGITNHKIPKFLLKMRWQPKSVIVLSQVLGSNRVNVLTEYCDLVINYQDKKPLKATVEEIV